MDTDAHQVLRPGRGSSSKSRIESQYLRAQSHKFKIVWTVGASFFNAAYSLPLKDSSRSCFVRYAKNSVVPVSAYALICGADLVTTKALADSTKVRLIWSGNNHATPTCWYVEESGRAKLFEISEQCGFRFGSLKLWQDKAPYHPADFSLNPTKFENRIPPSV